MASRPWREPRVTAPVEGGSLVGWRQGEGPPVLLLHGVPGLSSEYPDDLATELGADYEVAAFQHPGSVRAALGRLTAVS